MCLGHASAVQITSGRTHMERHMGAKVTEKGTRKAFIFDLGWHLENEIRISEKHYKLLSSGASLGPVLSVFWELFWRLLGSLL